MSKKEGSEEARRDEGERGIRNVCGECIRGSTYRRSGQAGCE